MKFLIIFIASCLFANYSIQVVSSKYINTSLRAFSKLKNYNCVRIEYINGFYVVRIGFERDKNNLIPLLEKIKSIYKDSFIIGAKFDKRRIIISRNCVLRKSIFEILKKKFSFKYKKKKQVVNPKKVKFPAYIDYSIASIENDRYKLRDILRKKDISYKDRVEGYIKIGEIGKAYNQIFYNLNNASLDYISYKQAVDFLSYLNSFLFLSSYEKSKNDEKFNFYIQNKLDSFLLFFYYTSYYSYYIDSYELDLKYKSFLVNLNQNNKKSFMGFSLFNKKKFNNFEIFSKVDFNKKSDESIYLLKNGKKHSFELQAKYYISYDEFLFNLKYIYYLYLDSFVGDGKSFTLKYRKYLRIGYPNVSYYLLYSNYFYTQKSLDKKILPDNSSLFGIGLNLGDRNLNFNNRIFPFLKFFAGYDFFQRNLEYEIYLGAKGRLFRKDYILFGIDYYKQLYTLYKFILSYKYYF